MKPDSYRDRRIADSAAASIDADRSLRCAARDCPNRWSVDMGEGRVCSAHAWADQRDWPAITEQQVRDDIDRIRRGQVPEPAAPRLSPGEKVALLQRLREVVTQRTAATNPRAWALALRDREHRGERLTPFQRQCWRDALGVRGGGDVVDEVQP